MNNLSTLSLIPYNNVIIWSTSILYHIYGKMSTLKCNIYEIKLIRESCRFFTPRISVRKYVGTIHFIR